MSTICEYWFPEFKSRSNAGGCRFDAPVWQLSFFLINLWCSFCPPLYIFCAEEFQPIILILKKAFLEQLTPKLLTIGGI